MIKKGKKNLVNFSRLSQKLKKKSLSPSSMKCEMLSSFCYEWVSKWIWMAKKKL